jgi:type VI secretion system protein ImpH
MAGADGREGPPLSELLLRESHRFAFFQAVRLLERLARERAEAGENWPFAPVGHDEAPDREVVRFRALPSQSFPTAPVVQLKAPAWRDPPSGGPRTPVEMIVAFLGLTGPQGVLPPHYTALLLRRIRDKDFALRDFLDLFNHRVISLFYRAWEKYRLPFAYERSRQAGQPADPCTQSLYCLVGLGTGGLRGRLDVADETFLYYAGHFAHSPRSAVALEGILADYFEVPVRIEQAKGQWLTLTEEDRTRLPGWGHPAPNNQLGQGFILGERVWDAPSKFRVRVGPVSRSRFRRFLPDGDTLRALCQLVRSYVGPDLDFDVQVVLEPAEVPAWQLGGGDAEGSRLGWSLWARNRDFERPVDDAVFFLDDSTKAG